MRAALLFLVSCVAIVSAGCQTRESLRPPPMEATAPPIPPDMVGRSWLIRLKSTRRSPEITLEGRVTHLDDQTLVMARPVRQEHKKQATAAFQEMSLFNVGGEDPHAKRVMKKDLTVRLIDIEFLSPLDEPPIAGLDAAYKKSAAASPMVPSVYK